MDEDEPGFKKPYPNLKFSGSLQEGGWSVEFESKRAGPFLREQLDSVTIASTLGLDFRRVARTLIQLSYGINSLKLDWAIAEIRHALDMLQIEAKVSRCSPCELKFESSKDLQDHFEVRHPEIKLGWLLKETANPKARISEVIR